ncbi:MAG: maleylacetoacetate isomerase, partial [Alphaproteobacteria bacterium]|nr:maleylacetoacetate isomerase [Alphaproteobacteria bacterium]
MKLYDYFRSSAAFRVRIALNIKGLQVDPQSVHLRRKDHRSDAYLAINPQGLVPALVDDDGTVVTQSLAIIEYLDETRPDTPRLMPDDARGRARVRALSDAIACDIHPLNNLRVLRHIGQAFDIDEATRNEAWYKHWIAEGMEGLEGMLAGSADTGEFCHGDTPTMADCCLIPQVYNAERF